MTPKDANEPTPQNTQSRELFVTTDTNEPLTEQMMDMETEEDDEADEESLRSE